MLMTPWGEHLDENCILTEYPRPQMRRDSYLNLNGRWEYAITDSDELPRRWDGTILVPFSPESALSGVGRSLQPGQTLWYRREVILPQGFIPADGRLLLHFGAVDQETAVYWNGRLLGRHMGGYNAFTLDATDALGPRNSLVVRVHDDTDASFHSRGKQKTRRGGIWYTPQSGIWQTVWMEAVPRHYIESLRIVPLFDQSAVEVMVRCSQPLQCEATVDGRTVPFTSGEPARIPMPDFRAWSPEDPYLYDLSVTLGEDRVESYFGMRKMEVRADRGGVKRLFLNGEPYFQSGLLDQGYWPDGLYTAPSDEALIYDIQTAKAMGFNLLRKHIKVEPMRWYYHCDRLGMLVWQDMPSGGGKYRFSTITLPLVTGIHRRDNHYRAFARASSQGRGEYMDELEEMVGQLFNAPSVVLWVPFNEGWGQFDSTLVMERLRALDPTRPVDPASGWHDQGAGELRSLHVYFKPFRFRRDRRGRALALSEFGGYNLRVDGHCFNQKDYGYRRLPDAAALWRDFSRLYEREVLPAVPKGLCASVYTQLSDVEDELNGLMTYDRRVVKLDADEVRELNERLKEASPRT
ncbi:MAG: glycoside hydrolase family 2 TIM barrel-domain containing protein [Christensenellales bacterium]|nr:glycoside hydrolase family 2 TIM barrel-domain containing protein [Christensenellales bacterium]